MTFEYTDFFFVLSFAFATQVASLVYLYKIRKLIGRRASRLFGLSNTMMLLYDIMIAYLIALAYSRPQTQQIELWGLYLAYIFPDGMGIISILKQRMLYRSVTPNEPRRFSWW